MKTGDGEITVHECSIFCGDVIETGGPCLNKSVLCMSSTCIEIIESLFSFNSVVDISGV